MTIFEHALVGINGTLAGSLQKRHGWQIVALAGVAAVVPDWDGLTIGFSSSLFAQGHRVWGHNLLACMLTGLVLGAADYRFDLVTRAARRLARLLPLGVSDEQLKIRDRFSLRGLATWTVVGTLATFSHLAGDLVVSGTATLADWELPLLWPFSDRGWVFPMVPWGDAGITITFVAGMFAMIRWKSRRQLVSRLTLAAVVTYVVARGVLAG